MEVGEQKLEEIRDVNRALLEGTLYLAETGLPVTDASGLPVVASQRDEE